MSIGQVDNCPQCGRLYVRNFKEVCPSCLQDIELQYEKCSKYLRENRKSNLQELHEATEVPYKQIIKFIKEGRISLYDMPNLSYPCEVCGKMIREQSMCDSCRNRLVKDIAQISEDRQTQDQAKSGFKIEDRLKDRHK
ncbi:TIGR03826 family flagellar region protein [Paenibacillus senegalensis]|uniref:TIGR03826 family flagellar region protein n=1 Tax=Paenibacillus senegalensis TaxID=1465766 RepID=UPI0002889863|nr:TIGR03826 family flagellar region protein [Paenibacillus senegalensis]